MSASGKTPAVTRLITIRFSHFCEKARWALDYGGVEYREEAHVPMFSWAATYGARGRRTVPVLATPEGTLSDSTDILRWVDARQAAPPLFPSDALGDEVSQWEEQFDRRLGPATRRLAYFHLLPNTGHVRRLLSSAGPAWETRAARLLFPVLKTAMVRGMQINAPGAERSLKTLNEVLDSVSAKLADGRRYLAGDRFTAADLTFAALLTPVLWPEAALRTIPFGYDEFPEVFRAEVERVRATPAGRFAMRLYAEERAATADGSAKARPR